MPAKLSNSYIDMNIHESLKRITDYENTKGCECEFACDQGHKFKANAEYIASRNAKCPICNKNEINWSNEKFDSLIKQYGLKMKRMTDVNKGHGQVEIFCESGDHSFITEPSIFFRKNGKHNCPICTNKFRKDDIFIVQSLDKKNPTIKYQEKKFICKICNFTIPENIEPYVVYYGRYKCQNCEKIKWLEFVNNRLKERENRTTLIGEYTNFKTKTSWKCNCCNQIWEDTPKRVLQSEIDCENCFPSSKKKSEKFILNLLKENFENVGYQKSLKDINLIHEDGYVQKIVFLDFTINYNNKIYFIEYNGPQHYIEIKFSPHIEEKDLKRVFIKQKTRDDWIKNYCIENNIKLFEINGVKNRYLKDIKSEIEKIIKEIKG